jgi:hypothetical protein
MEDLGDALIGRNVVDLLDVDFSRLLGAHAGVFAVTSFRHASAP